MNDKNFVIKRSEVYQRRGFLDITFLLLCILLLGGCMQQQSSRREAARNAYHEACISVLQGEKSRRSCSQALALIAPFSDGDLACAGMQGALLFALGYGEQAARAYRAALSVPGEQALRYQIWNDYACLLAQRGDLRGALVWWRRLLAEPAYPSPEVVWFNIAHALREREQYGLAMHALRRIQGCRAKC